MALRTAGQYLDSLRDGRVIYYAGERVADVTAHPVLRLQALENAKQYGAGAAEPAATLALRTMTLPDGELVHRWHLPPRSPEDLAAYVAMEEAIDGDPHGAMAAGLSALQILARRMDAKNGTDYTPRIEKYVDWYARTDLHGAFAMTDAKGDRTKKPSQQSDPDLYLRVIERRSDGIVIRGAKTSVTSAGFANELLVLPTQAMKEEDRDWAVACAVPANAPGVTMISNYTGQPWGERLRFDRPLTHSTVHHDATVIFEDVFVPHERVFMDGEHEFTRDLLIFFTSFHRIGILVREPRDTRRLIAAAQLIAECNAKTGDARDGIADMIQTAQLLDALRFTAINRAKLVEGICVPDAAACNLAGLTVTDSRERHLTFLCELAGGAVLTAPSGLDLDNPETGDLVRKYYVGAEGVSAEKRLRVTKYIYDLAASEAAGFNRAVEVTAGGTPKARRIALSRTFDMAAAVAELSRELGLE
jgi:4-hydroxybutyryl-CoA dehydratase / vinylacetyl-CoA-Delta-isomerase